MPQVPIAVANPVCLSAAAMKRRRAPELIAAAPPPRKSARLEALHREQPALAHGCVQDETYHSSEHVRREEATQQPTKPTSRKRSRAPNDSVAPSSPHRKRRRARAEESTACPADRSEFSEHPISHWAVHHEWPRWYSERGEDMERIFARKRSRSAGNRKPSDTDSAATPSSTDRESRGQKSAEYRQPQYGTLLATKNVFMRESELDISLGSKRVYERLLQQKGELPGDSLFSSDRFKASCRNIQDRNEARVIQDIGRLIVPSAEVLTTYGASHLQVLIESVNEGWNSSIPITKTRPQPDYAVGFRREAFTQDRLNRMRPIVGDLTQERSFFMATWYMYFPFLTCEVKCGAAALDVADRQNSHSTAIAVRAVVELFRAVKREKELHREILAFSISHDHRNVRIYGHYAEVGVGESETKYYRHPIHDFSFTAANGKEKWTAYNFTRNVYNDWMPTHFARICSAIDQIPADISFSVHSDSCYSERLSALSQDLEERSMIQSDAGSASIQGQDNVPSSSNREPTVASDTTVSDRLFKRPKGRRSAREPR
ncbi:unnamed protein product [Zymoseptoria tritici ST99CH_3D1]|nr:unnamed protein product [Zymoseptoria tritici ST99CH_3D1]